MRFSSSAPSTDITDRLARILGVTRSYIERAVQNGQGFGGEITVTAAAAQFAKTQVRNPAASGRVFLIYFWEATATNADTLFINSGEALLGGGTLAKNSRLGGADSLGVLASQSNPNPTVGPHHGSKPVAAGVPTQLVPAPHALWALPEATALSVQGITAANTLRAFVRWLELDVALLL